MDHMHPGETAGIEPIHRTGHTEPVPYFTIHYLAPSLPASAPKCPPSGREGADGVQSTGRYDKRGDSWGLWVGGDMSHAERPSKGGRAFEGNPEPGPVSVYVSDTQIGRSVADQLSPRSSRLRISTSIVIADDLTSSVPVADDVSVASTNTYRRSRPSYVVRPISLSPIATGA